MDESKTIKQRVIEIFNLDITLDSDILETKNWGCKQPFINKDYDVCYILKGGYSSDHYHNFNINCFRLLVGSVKIITGEYLCSYLLLPGRSIEIQPKIVHRFYALENSILLEEYNQIRKGDDFDIVRFNDGGIKDV